MLMAFAAPTLAAAEPARPAEPLKVKKAKVRIYAPSASKIGCTAKTAGIPCEGLERYRTGLGSTQVAYDVKAGSGPVVMYQVHSQAKGPLLASQAIAAIGIRKMFGKTWVQAGPGIARSGVGPGPRSVGIRKTVDQPRPALAGGVGMNLDKSDDPATLAIDFGTTVDSKDDEPQIYQVGASVSKKF